MLLNGIISMLNSVIKGFGVLISFISDLLPTSPFSTIDLSSIEKYIGYLNYCVPVGKIVQILVVWCSCIGLYYLYQIALRWIKVVE